MNESSVSPARNLKTDSLVPIDLLRLSDDDACNSTGLNTKTDIDIERVLKSHPIHLTLH